MIRIFDGPFTTVGFPPSPGMSGITYNGNGSGNIADFMGGDFRIEEPGKTRWCKREGQWYLLTVDYMLERDDVHDYVV